jgi:cardiolipin synthase
MTSRAPQGAVQPLRLMAEQAFSRAAGAPLVQENRIQLLKNAQENYPAWLEAISSAQKTVHFESYIIHADDIGNRFAKAREGVRVG